MLQVTTMNKETMNKLIAAGEARILTYIVSGNDQLYRIKKDGRTMIVQDREAAKSAQVKYNSVSFGGTVRCNIY